MEKSLRSVHRPFFLEPSRRLIAEFPGSFLQHQPIIGFGGAALSGGFRVLPATEELGQPLRPGRLIAGVQGSGLGHAHCGS